MADAAYHPGNLDLQPYSHEAVIELAKRARELGVQFKINGLPFGADALPNYELTASECSGMPPANDPVGEIIYQQDFHN